MHTRSLVRTLLLSFSLKPLFLHSRVALAVYMVTYQWKKLVVNSAIIDQVCHRELFLQFFFQCEKSKIQHNYIDTILTSCTIFFFDIFIFLLSLKMRGTFFLTTVPQSTEKSERRKLFFSDFPTTTRACVGAFPFFSTQHSVVAHVIFLFTCCLILLLSTFFFFLSTFNYSSLTLASFFSNSLALSLTHSLTFSMCCSMSEEIFFIFTANNILL